MKIVLATGIYPPDIGGPATYVDALVREFKHAGHKAEVVTYGTKFQDSSSKIQVHFVSKWGGPLLRWWRYTRVLRKVAVDADIVYAFSSVSCGVPVMLAHLRPLGFARGYGGQARLKKPKKILRLGGDFFWERYTDRGGMKGLRDWYAGKPWSRIFLQRILGRFDHIVFSTRFEEVLYEQAYALSAHSVIENAVPSGTPVLHRKHDPFRLLFMGRFVGFKNLPMLLEALALLPDAHITLVGGGPMEAELRALAAHLLTGGRFQFLPPVSGSEKQRLFAEHDLLILPSLTELSPNVALEARAAGLPVLLTRETGLSTELARGMVLAELSSAGEIAAAVRSVFGRYDAVAQESSLPAARHGWDDVAREHITLFEHL